MSKYQEQVDAILELRGSPAGDRVIEQIVGGLNETGEELVDAKFISSLGAWTQRTTWRYTETGFRGFPSPVIRSGPMVRWRKRDVLGWFRRLATHPIVDADTESKAATNDE